MSSKVTSQGAQKKNGLGSPPPSTPHATLATPLTTALALPTTKAAAIQGNALKVDNK